MEEKSWYALRIYYNKVIVCRDIFNIYNNVLKGINPPTSHFPEALQGEAMDYYAPLYEDTVTDGHGNHLVVERPFIPSLFFICSTQQQAECFEHNLPFKANLYRQIANSTQPIRIPTKQMDMFVRVTSGSLEGLDYLGEDAYAWRKGMRVRVTGGRFEGLEGEIKRIDGDKRLVVAIEGICAVATSYIPKCFLERI